MKVIKFLLKLSPVLFSFSCSQNPNTPRQQESFLAELPKWASLILENKTFTKNYELNFQINPFYLQADFNKDEFIDMAVLIKEQRSGKTGIALLLNGENKLAIFGAGQINSFGGDDWQWLRTWKTEPVLPAGAGVQPIGATLILFPKNKQQNALWLFWNGNFWQWKID